MPDRGSYWGPGLNSPSCSTWPRQGRPSVRWSRRAMIPSPLLRGAAVAALAALAIIWPGMVSARAQAQPRESAAQTSLSGSYLAARHAGGQRDAAAAASYYRAALRGAVIRRRRRGVALTTRVPSGEIAARGRGPRKAIARLRLGASGEHSRPGYGERSQCGHSRTPQGWRRDHGLSTPSGGRTPSARPR